MHCPRCGIAIDLPRAGGLPSCGRCGWVGEPILPAEPTPAAPALPPGVEIVPPWQPSSVAPPPVMAPWMPPPPGLRLRTTDTDALRKVRDRRRFRRAVVRAVGLGLVLLVLVRLLLMLK